LAKAQRYAEEMLSHSDDEWLFAFWSTLTLEFLVRAAVAHINPVLLADPKSHNNLYFALGIPPKATKFIPRSLDMSVVIERLGELVPNFDSTLKGFTVTHVAKRNDELHSGSTPFDSTSTGWIPQFYEACLVLLQSMGEDLPLLIGADKAQIAHKLIAAHKDASAKAVNKTIQQHAKAWAAMKPKEQQEASAYAAVWATRNAGHRVKCPSCNSPALVTGQPAAAPITSLENDHVIESQAYLPSAFECVACGLKIYGLAQINASGLGATFTATKAYPVAEYYSEHLEPQYEPDYNEM